MAAEFVSRLTKEFERPGLPAIALTTDTSFLTAFTNDCGFEGVFARQVQALGRPAGRADRHQHERQLHERDPGGGARARQRSCGRVVLTGCRRPAGEARRCHRRGAERGHPAHPGGAPRDRAHAVPAGRARHFGRSQTAEPERGDDHQPNAISHLVLRRRHRLSGLVPQARRRRAGHDDRQVLLHHVPLPAAVLRAPVSASSTPRSSTARRSTRSPIRRCARSCASSTIGRGVEIHHDGDLPARSGMGSSSAFTVGLLHALYALKGRDGQQAPAGHGEHPPRAGRPEGDRRLPGSGAGRLRRLQPHHLRPERRDLRAAGDARAGSECWS